MSIPVEALKLASKARVPRRELVFAPLVYTIAIVVYLAGAGSEGFVAYELQGLGAALTLLSSLGIAYIVYRLIEARNEHVRAVLIALEKLGTPEAAAAYAAIGSRLPRDRNSAAWAVLSFLAAPLAMVAVHFAFYRDMAVHERAEKEAFGLGEQCFHGISFLLYAALTIATLGAWGTVWLDKLVSMLRRHLLLHEALPLPPHVQELQRDAKQGQDQSRQS